MHELLRADQEHYWATWTNSCPYTIDAVYVTVRFVDRSSRELADGVWSLHFVPAGAHRTMRFNAPGKLADFVSVHQKKITGDMSEAFGRGPARPMSPMELAAVSAYRGAVAKEGGPRGETVSAVIGDSGEVRPAAEPVQETVLKEVLASAIALQAPVGDPGEPRFRTDFPDAWRAVSSALETTVSPAPKASFVRFVTDDKPLFR